MSGISEVADIDYLNVFRPKINFRGNDLRKLVVLIRIVLVGVNENLVIHSIFLN